MNHKSLFFKYVIPSIIAFALSGIYAIVDGYFVGNTIGDAGLSAINIAYPIVALIQALGTGIGMGGAVYYSINAAEKKGKRAEEFIATSWWLLVIVSVINTIIIYSFSSKILGLLGADGIILTNATDYIKIIALGAILQILGTGMMPFIRNYGNSFWSMFAMVGGFITNIVLDFIFVWIYEMGMKGAATATIAGQGVTAAIAIIYALYNKKFYVYVSLKNVKEMCGAIFRVGLAPFGLALTPNISLVFINRFSASYGGDSLHVSRHINFRYNRNMTFGSISYNFFCFFLCEESTIRLAIIFSRVMSDNRFRSFRTYFSQFRTTLDFDSPSLVFRQMPVETVDVVQSQHINKTLY